MYLDCRYGYQLAGKGKWMSMTLKKPKPKGGAKRGTKKKQQKQTERFEEDRKGSDDEDGDTIAEDRDNAENDITSEQPNNPAASAATTSDPVDLDDPLLTTPLPRYNAMLAALRNTLYMYVNPSSSLTNPLTNPL